MAKIKLNHLIKNKTKKTKLKNDKINDNPKIQEVDDKHAHSDNIPESAATVPKTIGENES